MKENICQVIYRTSHTVAKDVAVAKWNPDHRHLRVGSFEVGLCLFFSRLRCVRRRGSCSSARVSAVEPSTCTASLWPRPRKGSLFARSANQVRPCLPVFTFLLCERNTYKGIKKKVTICQSISPPPGVHTCFVCKKRSEDVRRCMIPVCGKFYHGECIASFAPTAPVSRGFRCSIHVCLTCFISNPNSSSVSKGKAARPAIGRRVAGPHTPSRAPDVVRWSIRRSSGAVCPLPGRLSRYGPLHGGGLRRAVQQQHRLSQPLRPPPRRQEPRTRQRQLVLRLHRR